MKVSVVIPAHNEEETLPSVLRDLYETIGTLRHTEWEVICVDDHSTDATASIAASFGAIVVQNHEKNGKGNALRRGFERATGEIVVMMDADYSHKPEALPLFLQSFQGDVGLVIASRVFGGSDEYTHVRALGNVFLSAAVGLSMGRYLSDALNGYKAFRRDVFTDFKYTSTSFEIEIELIANALRKGYKVIECSSHERARAGGLAKSRVVRHGTRFLMRIIFEGMRGVRPPAPVTLPGTAPAHTSGAGAAAAVPDGKRLASPEQP